MAEFRKTGDILIDADAWCELTEEVFDIPYRIARKHLIMMREEVMRGAEPQQQREARRQEYREMETTEFLSRQEWWATIPDGCDSITVMDMWQRCGYRPAKTRQEKVKYGQMIMELPGAVRCERITPSGHKSAYTIQINGQNLARYGKNLALDHPFRPKPASRNVHTLSGN